VEIQWLLSRTERSQAEVEVKVERRSDSLFSA